MKTKRVMIFRVGKPAIVEQLGDDLKSWQGVVGGYVERLRLTKSLALYCDEEGRLKNKSVNRSFGALGTGHKGDPDFIVYMHPGLAKPGEPGRYQFVGDFFVVREHKGSGGTTDLTDKDIAFLKELFSEQTGT